MATLEQLQSKISKLQEQANALLASKTQAAIQQIRKLMDAHGLTTADIETSGGAKAKQKKSTAPVKAVAPNGKLPPKYMNPKTGETWSGHARPPVWIKDVKDRSKFLIDGADATTDAVTKKTVSKVKQDVKRTVPPKYRDPKTGATWTGRGLPPKWIAAAKNRDRFLIDDATADAAIESARKGLAAAKKHASAKDAVSPKTSKPVAGKKAPAKKVAVKARKAPGRKVAPQSTPEPAPAEVATPEVAEMAEA